MKRLVAGPWVGEFGWELMSWQGYLRAVAPQYDEVVVCAPGGHELLYADFRTQYITYDHPGVKDCWWTRRGTADHTNINRMLAPLGEWLRPSHIVPIGEQAFVPFGDASKGRPADVLVHARAAIGTRPGHAWPEERWAILVQGLLKHGLTVAAIGTAAACPAGAEDRRGMLLSSLVNDIAAAGVVIGPSSGPLHLASLCRTPHLVWTDRLWYSAIRADNRKRYEELWNPLHTPCRVIDAYGWEPQPDVILKETLRYLDSVRRLANAHCA